MSLIDRRLISEFLGTSGLLIVIVGSGIMGESLSRDNGAITLLVNSLATGAGLYALIQTFGSISGAHFNPVVSLVEMLWRRLSWREFTLYSFAQILGAITGVWVTHFIFGQSIFQLSTHSRGEFRLLVSEVIASFGLMLVIALSGKRNVGATPAAVALYIVAAYWCTSSTSFANPAVTIARSLTDSFSGILWTGVMGFVLAQIIGALIAFKISRILSDGDAN